MLPLRCCSSWGVRLDAAICATASAAGSSGGGVNTHSTGNSSDAHVYASWGTARWIAIGIVLVAFVLIWLVGKYAPRLGPRYGGLFNGLDNRWSTSKVSIALWTIAVLWAFVTLLIRYGSSAVPQTVPGAYFALLGIPSAAALGAKAVTNQQAAAGGKTRLENPTNDPVKGLGQIFSDDTGSPDLLDSQYFLFNLVLLAYFVASFFHIAPPVGSNIILPALPGSLLALAGVSGATYLGKKALLVGATTAAAGAPQSAQNGQRVQDATLDGGTVTAVAQTDPDFVFEGIPPIEVADG